MRRLLGIKEAVCFELLVAGWIGHAWGWTVFALVATVYLVGDGHFFVIPSRHGSRRT